MIDLHCHVLPGVDDGPAELPEAVELAVGLAQLGFGELYPTPHQKAGIFAPLPEQTGRAADELRAALAAAGSPLSICPPGGENMWDELFLERRAGGFPTYPGGKAFLLEFPVGSVPPSAPEILFQMHLGGRLPVLAHVERYPQTFKDRRRAEALSQVAALLVNLAALGGAEGWGAKRLSRSLVKAGLVHAVASDAHRAADLPAVAAGVQWLRSRIGEEGAHRLLHSGPERIIAGELPD